jgi:hypothetical protein
MNFDRLPKERKEALVAVLRERHGWSTERAAGELRAMDEVGLAYVGVDARLARRAEKRYDEFQGCFELR